MNEISSIPAQMMSKTFLTRLLMMRCNYRENSLFIKKEVTDKNKEKIKDYLELNEALKDVIYKQKEDFQMMR